MATLGVRANKTMFSTTILRKPHGPRRIGCASREMKGSMRALCVGCFILVASVALVNAGDTCPVAVAPSLRVDCAYPGVTERQCAERKCCWGPGQASGVPECYYPGEAVPITTVHVVQVRQVVALALGGPVVTALAVRVRVCIIWAARRATSMWASRRWRTTSLTCTLTRTFRTPSSGQPSYAKPAALRSCVS